MEQIEVFTLCSLLFVISFGCSVNRSSLSAHTIANSSVQGKKTARGFLCRRRLSLLWDLSAKYRLSSQKSESWWPRLNQEKNNGRFCSPKTCGRHRPDVRLSCISLWKQKSDSVTLNQTGPDCPVPPACFPFLLGFALYLNYPGVNRQKHTRYSKTAGRKRFLMYWDFPPKATYF